MTTNQQLLADIRSFCKRMGMAETTFGKLAVNNWRLVERLADGRSVTLTVADRIRKYISENQPTDEGREVRRRVA